MKLFFVVLLAYGVWATPGSSRYRGHGGYGGHGSFPKNGGSPRNGDYPDPSRSADSLNYAGYPGSHYKEADVFWRTFDGRVPRDAIEGNDFPSDDFIFVGMGYFKGIGMMPGTLHPGNSSLQVTANGKAFTMDENIHILCSHRKFNVRWMEVNYADVACLKRIPGIRLVDGGVEDGVKLFVGRHEHEGKMQVGKVYTKAPYEGLHLINKRGGATTYNKFEILVYV